MTFLSSLTSLCGKRILVVKSNKQGKVQISLFTLAGWQLCHGSGALVDMTSNQNAPSTKGADSDWLMGISTKATSNQIPSVLKVPILIGGILSLQCQACYKTQKADSFTTRPTGASHSVSYLPVIPGTVISVSRAIIIIISIYLLATIS
jgi:hypothetical protein